jgi:hypothetical protein
MNMKTWRFPANSLKNQPHCQVNQVVLIPRNQMGIFSLGRDSQARLWLRFKGDTMAEIQGDAQTVKTGTQIGGGCRC